MSAQECGHWLEWRSFFILKRKSLNKVISKFMVLGDEVEMLSIGDEV